MHVAICIVGFRNPQDITRCLAALAGSTHKDFEIVICENGGADAADELRAHLPSSLPDGQRIRLLTADNPGYAGGVNLCISAASDADSWWVLNPDTEPSPRALEHLCAAIATGDRDAVGCTVHYADGSVESRGGQWKPWLARALSLDNGASIDEPADVGQLEAKLNFLNGASMLVSRRFVEVTGLLREEYFLYAEEVEWCLRGMARGMKLGLAANANVMHLKGATTGATRDMKQRNRAPVYLDERNKILLTRDLFAKNLPVAAPAALMLLCLRFARRGAWRQLGYAVSGWWAGVCNKRGKPAWIS